jgi:hypothetical protein
MNKMTLIDIEGISSTWELPAWIGMVSEFNKSSVGENGVRFTDLSGREKHPTFSHS